MELTLTSDQIKQLLKEPLNANLIKRAKEYQSRIKLHSQAQDILLEDNSAYNNFIAWLRKRIPNEKFDAVARLIKTPISTNKLTSEIYNHFTKIFHASDGNKEYTISNEGQKEDVIQQLKDQKEFFTKKAFQKFKQCPCDFVVVSLPNEESEEIKPFAEFIPIEKVIDAKIKDSEVLYCIFQIEEKKFCVVDGEGWKIYEGEQDDAKEVEVILHGLSYAPIRQFWTDNINDNEFVKQVPISNQLGDLDFLLWKIISREYAESYAEYPILWKYEEDDDFDNYGNKKYLDNQITSSSFESVHDYDDYKARQNLRLTNGEAKAKADDGPGDVIYKSYPKEGQPDVGVPAGFISADVVSLEYIKKNVEDRHSEIYTASTGALQEFKNDQAKNEKQVNSQYETSRAILIEVKRNFELFEKWVSTTIGQLMIGESFEDCSINYGTNFFLQTINSIEEGIKFSKENNLNEGYIAQQYDQLIQTKHKHDPIMRKRGELLFALEPMPTLGIMQAFEMAKAGLVTDEDFEIKRNFSSLIAQYEAKYGPLDLRDITQKEDILSKLKDFLPEKEIKEPIKPNDNNEE